MANRNINSKTYDLVVRTVASFNIFIKDFQFATTFIFRIRDRISITFSGSLTAKISSIINLKKVRLVISQMKLTVRPTQTINSRRISIVTSMKQSMKAVTNITQLHPIDITSKARQRIIAILGTGKLKVIVEPVLATFYTLGTYDPTTLGVNDSKTLGEMDYLET